MLKDEPLTDLSTVASPLTSQLQLVGVAPGGRVGVGQNVTVRVLLKDEVGRAVLTGGHEVRVWMVGQANKTSYKAAVDVMDLRNGTYVASLPVLWSGKIEVLASLLRPREFRRVVLTLMDKMKMMNQIPAAFVNGKTEQVDESQKHTLYITDDMCLDSLTDVDNDLTFHLVKLL